MLFTLGFFVLLHFSESFREFVYRTWYVAGCVGFLGSSGYLAYIMYFQFYDPSQIEGMFLANINDLRILLCLPIIGTFICIIIVNVILKMIFSVIFEDIKNI
jgi:hypothetical protein